MGATSTCVLLSIGYFLGHVLHISVVWFIFFLMSVYAVSERFLVSPERTNLRFRHYAKMAARGTASLTDLPTTGSIGMDWASIVTAILLPMSLCFADAATNSHTTPTESSNQSGITSDTDGATREDHASHPDFRDPIGSINDQENAVAVAVAEHLGVQDASTPSPQEGLTLHCLNALIDGAWKHPCDRVRPQQLIALLNNWIRETKLLSSILESIRILDISLGSIPPHVESAHILQHSISQTDIEMNIAYEGDFFIQWTLRPRVVPINMRCMLSHVVVRAKLRVSIKYEDDRVSEIRTSLSEYPSTLTGALQLFDSLDYNSLSDALPSLTASIRKQFRNTISHLVFPRSIPLWTNRNGTSPQTDPAPFISTTLRKDELDGLEDEIRSSLLQIDQLLNMSKKTAGDNDAAKTDIAKSLIQFLQFSSQPGRVPVSMMDTVKRGFDVLTGLAFNNASPNKAVLEVILQREALGFLASIVRKCPGLADQLFLDMFRVDEPELRSRINAALTESELQDIPFVVFNRTDHHRR